MSTKRWQLLEAVQTCLQAISTSATPPYNTSAGEVVTLEPSQIQDDGTIALGVVIESQKKATDPAVVRTHRLTTILIAIRVPTGLDDAQAWLDAAIDDVERAMEDKQTAYPPGVTFPQYDSMQPTLPPKDSNWIGAVLRYTSHVPKR